MSLVTLSDNMQLNTNTTLSSLLDKYAPIVTKLSRRQSPSKPWFSTNLCAFLSTLRHAENIWKRTQSAADWSSFKSLRNQNHKLIPYSYPQPSITPNVFGKQSTNSHTANFLTNTHHFSLHITCRQLCFFFHRQNIQTPSLSPATLLPCSALTLSSCHSP